MSANALIKLFVLLAFFSIMAAITVPHLPFNLQRTHELMLTARLSALRNAADLYYHEHLHRYPGEYNPVDGKSRFHQGQEAEAAAALVAQLTLYTDEDGRVNRTRTATFNLGPYLPGGKLPGNPFMSGAAAQAVEIDFTLTKPYVIYPADGRTGWRLYMETGRLVANDNAELEDGLQTAYQ